MSWFEAVSETDVFKALVVGLLVIFGVVSLYIMLASPELPDAAIRYYEWQQGRAGNEIEYLVQGVALLVLLATLFSAVGLLFFVSMARYVFIFSVVFMAFHELLVSTPMLLTGFELFVDTVVSVLAGAIIVMSFSGSVARKFKE